MNKKRAAVFIVICIALVLVWGVHTVMSFGYIEGVDPDVDKIKALITTDDVVKNTLEGDILDADGNVICYSNTVGEGGIIDHECYYSLVGYSTGKRFGRSGLRSYYYEELWTPDKNGKGATVTLTTNSAVQSLAYDEIKGTDGCVVVLENKTGRVIALASSKADYNLDYNNITQETMEKANSCIGFFTPNWNVALAPGSVFKAVTSVPIIEKGYAGDIYNDDGTEVVDGFTFHNFRNRSFGEVNLTGALKDSVNTYYANMGIKLGSYTMRDICRRFMLGETIKLDFGIVKSKHNLDSNVSRTNVAATAFGQGELLVSPLNTAMIAQAIANDGVMLKPYVVESIVTGDGKTVRKGEKEVLSKVADKATMKELQEALMETAVYYGVDRKLKIGAKTGTAQVPNQLNRASFMAFNEDYTVVIVVNDTSRGGGSYMDAALRIFKALENID